MMACRTRGVRRALANARPDSAASARAQCVATLLEPLEALLKALATPLGALSALLPLLSPPLVAALEPILTALLEVLTDPLAGSSATLLDRRRSRVRIRGRNGSGEGKEGGQDGGKCAAHGGGLPFGRRGCRRNRPNGPGFRAAPPAAPTGASTRPRPTLGSPPFEAREPPPGDVTNRGRSSAGRALRSQRRGRGFDPLRLHHVPRSGGHPGRVRGTR